MSRRSSPAAKNVLGDSLDSLPQRDALGRGCKGYAHGSIAYKTCRRQRKSGQVKEYQQAWYQWQDKTGKHCRYLNQKKAAAVQQMLDEGATVPQILEFLEGASAAPKPSEPCPK